MNPDDQDSIINSFVTRAQDCDIIRFLCCTVSSVPMRNVHKLLRNRTMSMEEYDKPMRERKASVGLMSSDSVECSTP